MLKLTHVQARLSIKNGQASLKQMDPTDPTDRQRALEVIELFQKAAAARLTREKLDAKLAAYAGSRLDYREIDGLAKVISDSFSRFEPDPLPLTGLDPKPDAIELEEANEDTENLEDEIAELPESEEDTSQATGSTLGTFRLNLWQEATRPENSPFHRPGLTVALKPGLQSLRKAAATHDEDLLANLLPQELRRTLLQEAARLGGYELKTDAPTAPGELGNWLFADVPERHRLTSLSPELDLDNLLNRYNIELLRGVLYLAPRIRLVVRDKYKDLFKYIKLFRLMHEVKPIPLPSQAGASQFIDESGWLAENQIGGYEILLEGASSPFLARTDRRYGIQFARFLPALLLCEAEWQLETELIFPSGGGQGSREDVYRASYRLGPQSHLRTHFKGSGEFDSRLEEDLAAAFEQRFQTTSRAPAASFPPEQPLETEIPPPTKKHKAKRKKPEGERQGWTIKREDRIIPVFDTVMIPDFAFEHRDGRRALLEVVGFWEKGYLERKIAKLNRAGRRDLIVLVSERTRCGRDHFLFKGQEPPYQLIFFKGKPQLGPILAALEKCAVPAIGSPEES